MEEKRLSLTEAEWRVMECLWEKSPRIGRELTEELGKSCGWSRSTTLTLLRRLEAKGTVGSGDEKGVKTFLPLLSREDAALGETEDLLSRVYRGSLSLLVSSFTEKRELSRQELDELHAILKGLEEDRDA